MMAGFIVVGLENKAGSVMGIQRIKAPLLQYLYLVNTVPLQKKVLVALLIMLGQASAVSMHHKVQFFLRDAIADLPTLCGQTIDIFSFFLLVYTQLFGYLGEASGQ